MPKYLSSAALDAALDAVRTQADIILFCTLQPATVSEAQQNACAQNSLSAADFSVSGSGSGTQRNLTLRALTNITASSSGAVTHAVLANSSNGAVLLCAPIATATVATGDTLNFSALQLSAKFITT